MHVLRRRAVAYFGFQASAVAIWWIALWVRPEWRRAFLAPGQNDVTLLAFWLPDLLLLVAGSAGVSWSIARRAPLTGAAVWLTTGAVSYAALYCLMLSLSTGGGWLATVLMLPSMVVTGSFALAVAGGPAVFRRARPASRGWNMAKTAMQIAVVWGTTLLLLPMGIVAVQDRLGWPVADVPGQLATGLLLFTGFSSLGLWSGYTMAARGAGTPLPLDAPRTMVIDGPYGYVRNPMALAGLGQGLSVSLMTGSLLVLLYVVLGGSIWQWIVRPVEEEDMAGMFGEDYARYREAVRCWTPRTRPYRGAARELTTAEPRRGPGIQV